MDVNGVYGPTFDWRGTTIRLLLTDQSLAAPIPYSMPATVKDIDNNVCTSMYKCYSTCWLHTQDVENLIWLVVIQQFEAELK